MEIQELINQLSSSSPSDLNTQVLLHILRGMTEISNKMDIAIENYKKLESGFADFEKRLSALEKIPEKSANDNNLILTPGESPKTTEEIETLRNENNYLYQWRIDSDVFLSGFLLKSDIDEVSTRLSEIYNFSQQEITYKYSFTYTNPRTKSKHHYAVIGFNKRNIKNTIFAEKIAKGPLFWSDIIGAHTGPDPQIHISNRLTTMNLRLQKELQNLQNKSLLHKILYKNCSLYLVPSPNINPVPIKSFKDIETFINSTQNAISNPYSASHSTANLQGEGIVFQQTQQQRITAYFTRS